MYKQLENLQNLYGDNAHVQIPNDIFKMLSLHIKNKNGSTNIQQSSFTYAYIVMIAFLYKYAHFVDIDNGTYIQNADIKELLGYGRTTKTVDHIIKKGGMLDAMGLTKTVKNCPIRFNDHPFETINNIPLREFVTVNEIDANDINYKAIKVIVKNRNYEVKEPLFLFEYEDDIGTLYNYANTHKVTIKEILHLLKNKNINTIDIAMYFFFKSKCQGLDDNMKSLALTLIIEELGVGKDAFYKHLDVLKESKYINVTHKGWVMGSQALLESNEYYFKGI